MPDYLLFAVMENNIVIDCCFDNDGKMISPLSKKEYKSDSITFIPMTLDNSPAEIGMSYDNTSNKFYLEGVNNASVC
jgi:hypothetical protein